VGGGGVFAFIGGPSGSYQIPLPPGWACAQGFAINNSGQVAGTGCPSVPYIGYQAFIGTTTSAAAIPLPPGWTFGGASALNELGQVAGTALNGVNGTYGVTSQPFIGTISGSMAIPLPPGWTSGGASAVNASGQVAGTGINQAGNLQAFIGTIAGSIAIPLPSGATTATVNYQSLNDLGMVVGSSNAGSWIWDASGGTRVLTSLVPPGWYVTNAISISGNGLILAQAFQGCCGGNQYVELIPAAPSGTPAPSTLTLLLISAIFCGIWLRLARLHQKAG
jgi:hypothetical protein